MKKRAEDEDYERCEVKWQEVLTDRKSTHTENLTYTHHQHFASRLMHQHEAMW